MIVITTEQAYAFMCAVSTELGALGHDATVVDWTVAVSGRAELAVNERNKLRLCEVVRAVDCGAARAGRWVGANESAKSVAAEIVERHAERLRQDAIRASRDAVLAQERAMADVLREAVGDAAEVETGRAIVDLRGLDVATLRRVGAAIRGAVKP